MQPVLLAMLVARVTDPASKRAMHRALDWLHDAQDGIERRSAREHLLGHTGALRPHLCATTGAPVTK